MDAAFREAIYVLTLSFEDVEVIKKNQTITFNVDRVLILYTLLLCGSDYTSFRCFLIS